MRENTKLPWWGWAAALFLLPVVYVLSVFPVAWISLHFDLECPEWIGAFYRPVGWARDEWDWFSRIVDWIVERMGLN